MADLEPRVKQVEEDVAILKGEIKSVLIEVRTSLLSQSNPFTNAGPAVPPPVFAAPVFAAPAEPAKPEGSPVLKEEVKPDDKPLHFDNQNSFAQPERQFAPQQQPVSLPVAPRRSWE